MNPSSQSSESLTLPFFDFWLLGGASIALYLAMVVGDIYRGEFGVITMRFSQVAGAFALLSLICNHPHFLISYKFGYGRGIEFIFQHWLSLLFVPIALIALYAFAYFNFNLEIADRPAVTRINQALAMTGLGYRVGGLANLGSELMSFSVWMMYLTVGWHYSKQIFGCVMVYAKFSGYRFLNWQRHLFKLSVFSVALFQLCSLSQSVDQAKSLGQSFNFFNVAMAPLGIPGYIVRFSSILVPLSFVATVLGVFVWNWRARKSLPHVNVIVPWVAFYVWWFPIYHQPEYYLAAVPFFHSLQYLPFAYKVDWTNIKERKNLYVKMSIRIAILFLVGFASFEFVPSILDETFKTEDHQVAWFFSLAALVFINVHHFFIDSVVWKFDQKDVQGALFPNAAKIRFRRVETGISQRLVKPSA